MLDLGVVAWSAESGVRAGDTSTYKDILLGGAVLISLSLLGCGMLLLA